MNLPKSNLILSLSLIIVGVLSGCENASDETTGRNGILPGRKPPMLAEGWKDIKIQALLTTTISPNAGESFAKMEVNSAGHYWSEWGICYRRPYGAGNPMTPEEWNFFAGAFNSAMTGALLSTPRCQAYNAEAPENLAPHLRRGFGGYHADQVVVERENEKLTVLTVEDGQLCSIVPDPKTALDMARAISIVMSGAVIADCADRI